MLCSSNLCYHKQEFGPPYCCWLSHERGIGLKAVLLQRNKKKSVVDEGQLVVLWTGNRETLIEAVTRKNIALMKRARFTFLKHACNLFLTIPLLSYNHHKNESLGTLPACIYVTQKFLEVHISGNYLHLRVLLQAYRCTSQRKNLHYA